MTNGQEDTNLHELSQQLDELNQKEEKLKKTITELQYKKTTIETEIASLKNELSTTYNVSSLGELKKLLNEKKEDLIQELKTASENQTANQETIDNILKQLENLKNE